MMIIKQLAAQLHIEFSVELCDALLDVFRLNLEVFLVVESYFHLSVGLFFACKGTLFFRNTKAKTKKISIISVTSTHQLATWPPCDRPALSPRNKVRPVGW